MLLSKKLTPFLLCMLLMAYSCHDDYIAPNEGSTTTEIITKPIDFEEVMGDLVGIVTDDAGEAVAGAQISYYGGGTTTDALGIFNFENIPMDRQGTYIVVKKDGFLDGYDRVYPDNGINSSKIQLEKINTGISFSATDGGTIAIPNGGSATISPNSIRQEDGSTYNGDVTVSTYVLDEEDAAFGNTMPGGLIGIDLQSRHRTLGHFTMMRMEFTDESGNPLTFKSGFSASVKLPIKNDLIPSAPSTIKTWIFNASTGYWNEVSTGERGGNFYNLTIDDTGFWLGATDYSLAHVCGRVIDQDGLPVQNHEIRIKADNTLTRIGYTDSDGYYCGKVPGEEDLQIFVLRPNCNQSIATEIIGPFSGIEDAPTIQVNQDKQIQEGQVTCDDTPLTNTSLILNSENGAALYFPSSDGTFSLDHITLFCGGDEEITIHAVDHTTGNTSPVRVIQEGELASLKIEICNTDCDLEIDLRFEKDEPCVAGDYERLFADATGGTGNYEYQWTSGGADIFVENPEFGITYCCTVIDLTTGCDASKCVVVNTHTPLTIQENKISNNSCAINSGVIEMNPIGGLGDISYVWEGPAGFAFDGEIAENLAPGVYTILAKDGYDCEDVVEITLEDPNTPLEFDVTPFCDVSQVIVNIKGGLEPFDIDWSGGQGVQNELYVSEPGQYSVTVTDANNCVRTGSVSISSIGQLPDFDIQSQCHDDIVQYQNFVQGFTYFFKPDMATNDINVSFQGSIINLSVFETGYVYEIGCFVPGNSECEIRESVALPRFDGIESVTGNDTSCGGCNDGYIDVVIDDNGSCIGCELGDVAIINVNNNTDVTQMNEMQALQAGEYYVIVKDNSTGCYVAHREVQIN